MSTLSSTFYLKHPKSEKETLILFSCYFKNEQKKFVYSTGEKINPRNWDFKNHQPIRKGVNKTEYHLGIDTQLNRYKDKFQQTQVRSKIVKEDFTSQILRKEFDIHFKRTSINKNIFFDAFDTFIDQNKMLHKWSISTLKRYHLIKGLLLRFQKERNYKLTFSRINQQFHAEFTHYCMGHLGHINNTFSRNMGLVKTFLFWAIRNGYTYNEEFKSFRLKPKVVTKQIALTLKDINYLMSLTFSSKRLEGVRDIFAFACTTGLRYGELKLIKKNNVVNNQLILKEEKDSYKIARTIPLPDLALGILFKYNYKLPYISNQKQNDYLKEIFKLAGYNSPVVKEQTRGIEILRTEMPFYERISTHTARRTFITLMKKNGVSDKLIASITGHKDMKTLNQYYQIDDESRIVAINQVFTMKFEPLRKVD